MSATPLNDLGKTLLVNSRRWFPEVSRNGFESEVIHMTLGIAGESGEVVELVKKAHRYGTISGIDAEKLAFELADVLTYILNLSTVMGINLDNALAEKQAVCEARWGRP